MTMRILCAVCVVGMVSWRIESAPLDVESNITIVRADHPVLAQAPRLPMVEPHLAIDPRDGNHLVAAAISVKKGDLSASDCAALVSFDGGRIWSQHELSFLECGDPWVAITEDGTILLTVLGRAMGQEDRPDHLQVLRSEDGGRTWREPLSLGTGHDHETIAVDRSEGPYRGSVYVVSQAYAEDASGKGRSVAFVARSSDGDRSFQTPAHLFLSNLSLNTMSPVVLSDGTLAVSFEDYARPVENGQLWLERERSWVVVSSDGGRTFSIPMLVSEACGRSFGGLAVDASSGRFRDRLYWICTSSRYEDVYLHYSSDQGERWTKPMRVNQGSGTSPYVRTPASR